MNREIKFRAWDGKRITTSGIMFNNSNGYIELPKTINDPVMALMQYTGLKDKNGVEIYEGDICNRYHLKGVVTYTNGMFILQDGFNKPLKNEIYELEVIGNIYENPELLK